MQRNLNTILAYTSQEGNCLIWTRCLNTDGYPRALMDGNANMKIHRVVYELATGTSLPKGVVVRHTCDNPKCINPDHLISGTPADNMMDRDLRERHGMAKINRQQVVMIRALWSSGEYLQKDLAKAFGLNERTISSLVNGKHWKHVE